MKPFTYVSETFVRLRAGEHHVDIPLNHDEDCLEVFRIAHSRVDSQIPHPKIIGTQMWSTCLRYRKGENELRAKIGLPPLPTITASAVESAGDIYRKSAGDNQ